MVRGELFGGLPGVLAGGSERKIHVVTMVLCVFVFFACRMQV